jgi:uncharacterized protein YlaI
MTKENKCAICDESILEENKKLKGTILKVKNENNENEFIYVCNNCQKKQDWIEVAKVKSA